MKKRSFVDWLYTTRTGRAALLVLLHTGALKAGEKVARSSLSKPFIDKYIKNNMEVLSVGDIVKVKVLEVDAKKNRISLTMKI